MDLEGDVVCFTPDTPGVFEFTLYFGAWDGFNGNQAYFDISPITVTVVPSDSDLNSDGCVDKADYTIIMADIRGGAPFNMAHDLNGDGVVNIADARFLVTRFTNPRGAACP